MANDAMRHLWTEVSGNVWVEHARLFDRMLESISAQLLEAVTAAPGDRVLDVGCGTGTFTAAVASLDTVPTGVDISPTMIAGAQARFPDLDFLVADAQSDPLPGPFDAVVSRFGVMFFEDPVAAFANIGAACRDGAALTFSCWRGLDENPAMAVGARKLVAAMPEPPPPVDPTAPGPMAFADPARLRGILIDAGWSAIDIHPLDTICRYDIDGSDGIEERMTLLLGAETGRRFLEQVPPEDRGPGLDAARADVASALVDGHVELPAAGWLVRARR